MEKIKNDKVIQDFYNLMSGIVSEYQKYTKIVNDMDKSTQDILHQLELGERITISKWSKELVNIRKKRRLAKNVVMKIEPIYDYYMSNQKEINRLVNLIGDIRKVEKKQEEMVYIPRVIQIEISKNNL